MLLEQPGVDINFRDENGKVCYLVAADTDLHLNFASKDLNRHPKMAERLRIKKLYRSRLVVGFPKNVKHHPF